MFFMTLSTIIIPLMLFFVIGHAIRKKVNVYDVFIKGAKEGIEISVNLFPYILGMIVAINILLKSNIINDLLGLMKPLFELIKVPIQIIPMAIMRPLSGSSSLVLMNDIFTNYGVDSFLGRLASTIQGGNDTTVYILTLYFGFIGIKKIKYALWVGLLTDFICIIISITVVSLLFN